MMRCAAVRFAAGVTRALSVCLLLALANVATAQQQIYPSKPIRIISPYPPGGTTDILARLVGQKLNESWGQQVLVENRPGGNTIIGTEMLVKSPPDGYTLLSILTTHVIVPNLQPTSYDPIRDFIAVATFTSTEQVLVMHPSVPVNTLQELIALAKARPGQLNFASGGSGTASHLAGELFNLMAGIRMQHIPYKGSAPATNDLVGGQVQLFFGPPIVTLPHIRSGRIKAIAIGGEARMSALPRVPTFTQAGLPGYDAKIWYGMLAPAGTPGDVINRLSSEIARILAMPDIRERLVGQGMDPFISSPDQFAALIRADFAKWGKVIKTANIRLEN